MHPVCKKMHPFARKNQIVSIYQCQNRGYVGLENTPLQKGVRQFQYIVIGQKKSTWVSLCFKSSLYYGYNLTPLKRFAEKSDTNYETICSKKVTPWNDYSKKVTPWNDLLRKVTLWNDYRKKVTPYMYSIIEDKYDPQLTLKMFACGRIFLYFSIII